MTKTTITALLLIVCAVAVRSSAVWSYFYSPDELMHFSISQGSSLGEVLQRSTEEVHPPLEQILKWLVVGVTDDIVVLRTLYCAVGIAAIAALALAARAAGGAGAGLACLALAAFMPASVWASVLVRGYGLFLLTCSLALREFFLIVRARPQELLAHSCWLGVWLVLACATNFSGFLLAGALILSLVVLLIRDKKPRAVVVALLLGTAVLVEGAVFYWWYFSLGTGATEWRTVSHSSYFESCASFASFPVFMLRLLTLFSPLPSTTLPPDLLVGFGAGAAVFYLYVLRSIAAKYPKVVLFVVTQWVFAVALNFTGLYPLVGPRHSIYLLPAIVIPIALCAGPIVLKRLHYVGVTAILLTVLLMRGAYFNRASDFPIASTTYEAAREYLRREVAPGDLMLTSRFGLLYVLYDIDKLQTFYHPQQDLYATSFLGHSVLASTRGRMWQLTRDDLLSLLASVRNRSDGSGSMIWLFSFGFQDHVMERILHCATAAHVTVKGMHEPGVFITGLRLHELERLAAPDGECLRDYKDNLCAGQIQ